MAQAQTLDAADPLAQYRSLFIDSPDVVAYLDGNSLGRPLKASAARISEFVTDAWAARLIRGWAATKSFSTPTTFPPTATCWNPLLQSEV